MIIAKFRNDERKMRSTMIIGMLIVCFAWALPNQLSAQSGNLSPAPITPYGPDPNPPFVYPNNMAKFRCNNITATADSTLVTFDYQMWDDYEGNYQAKIELLIDGEVVTESYNFHLVDDLGQGAYSIQLDMNSLNASGAVIHVFLEPTPINDSVGYVYGFSREGSNVTIESITTQLVGGTPMAAVPADPHCSTCEGIGTSSRGGGLCHHFANQGEIHIDSDVVGAITTCGSGNGSGPVSGHEPVIHVDDNSRPTVPTVGADPGCGTDDGWRLCNGCDAGDGLRLKANFLETAIVSDFANAWYGGSFGPGLFLTQVDSTGYLQVQAQNGNFFRVFDAGLRHATTLEDMDLDGIFYDEHGLYREAKLVDVNGDPVTVIDSATRMRITRHDGSTLCFSFGDGTYELDGVPNIDLDAQIAELIDRNGNETKILRGVNEVTVEDRYGYQLVLTYSDNEVTARSVVTNMRLPNGQDVTFQYANDFLSQANYPEGLTWTFAISTNSTSQTVDITVDSPTAIPMVYKISQDFMEYNAQIISQPANVLRGVFDTFANNYMSVFTDYTGLNPDAIRVFYGSDRLFGMELGRFISVAKVFTSPDSAGFEIEQEFDAFNPVIWEDHFAENLFTTITYGGGQHTDDDTDRTCGAPSEIRTENGDVLTNLYDADNYVVYREYPDGTYESWEYNINKQVTRYRDRLANVTKYEYADEAGGWTLLKRKVGIKDLSADLFRSSE